MLAIRFARAFFAIAIVAVLLGPAQARFRHGGGVVPAGGPPVITFNAPSATYIYPAASGSSFTPSTVTATVSTGSFLGGGGTFSSSNCPASNISVASGGAVSVAGPSNLSGNQSCLITAHYPGATNVTQTFNLTGTQQTIASISPCSLAGCTYTFTVPATSYTLDSIPNVTMSGGISFAAGGGTIALNSNAQCSNFAISGSNLQITATPAATYGCNYIFTDANASNSPQAASITAIGNNPSVVSNTMTVSTANGTTTTDYPLQFGRPFIEGAIPHSPQVLIDGVAVSSQADVKNRYPDGSVEFAVIAVHVPAMSENACDISNTNPALMPPFALWSQHSNTPVFNTPTTATPVSDSAGNWKNTLTAPNCAHYDGGQGPRTMVTTENTAAPSQIGGQMGFTEYPPFNLVRGSMFSSMVCNGTSWCPELSVGLDEEGGGIWPTTAAGASWTTVSTITATSNGDGVIGVDSPGGAGSANVYFNGVLHAHGPITEALVTQGNYVWGSDGDHLYLGPVIGFEQMFFNNVLTAPQHAALSAALQQAYSTGTGAVPCSTVTGITCDMGLSVTQRLITGATKAFKLYNVSAGTTHDVGFLSNNLVNTADALSFCGTVGNCRYETVYDQVAQVAVQATPQSHVITFQDNPTPNNTPLTLGAMEALLPIGAANMVLTSTGGGTTYGTADAGQMLVDGHCAAWTSGPIAQTMICGDDTATRAYDIGTGDGFHPFRPHFYVTFWPSTSQVFVRAAGEADLATELENLSYVLTLNANGSPVYTKALDGTATVAGDPLVHWTETRWAREFWLGGAPPLQVNIDNNLAYLDSTRFFPNLDTTIAMNTAGTPFNAYEGYISNPHDIYDGIEDGAYDDYGWTMAQGNVGNSPHIGPFPYQFQGWLHTADWRYRYIALNQIDLAGAWPGFMRETGTTRILQRGDTAGSGTGLGKFISAAGRPLWQAGGAPTDNPIVVGPITTGPWSWTTDHQPSVYFPAYVLTGDPYYLENEEFWAGFSVFRNATPNYYVCTTQTTDCSKFRGPTGAYAGLFGYGAPRDSAWTIRGRAEAAFAAVDGTPEKSYFRYSMNDAIAKWEGALGINGTVFDTATIKTWVESTTYPYYSTAVGNTVVNGGIPTLGEFACIGNTPLTGSTITSYGMLSGANNCYDQAWMIFYMDYGLGRAIELGWTTLLPVHTHYTVPFTIGMFNSYPYLAEGYEIGVASVATNNFWPDWPTYFANGVDPTTYASFATAGQWQADMQGGRSAYAGPGLAMAVDEGLSGATTAWSWYYTNGYTLPTTVSFNNGDPRWAIVPRTDHNVLPAQPTTTPP
jgi:hypothetical protein